ncbi:hypothetical protein BHM03_00005825 [Ensete ventricosum]|nr:hypothetical protein BHM03_00005825 [Ensete ventricosum]
MPNAHPSLVIQVFLIGLHSSCFFWSLIKRPPVTIPEMLQKANQYVTAEALIWEKGLLRVPNLIDRRSETKGVIIAFYYDYGHDTEECYNLKNQIKDLIHRRHLDRYVRRLCEPSLHLKGPVEKQIDYIISRPTS